MKINEIVSEAPAAIQKIGKGLQKIGKNVGQATQNFLYKKTPSGQFDYRSKIGSFLSKIGSGAAVKDYSKSNIDSDQFNTFLGLLSKDQSDLEQNDIEKSIKSILDNGTDEMSRKKVIVYINKFFNANRGVTLADFNTQFRSVLDKLKIKPQDIKVPPAQPTAQTPTATQGASTILGPSGKPLPKTA